MDSSNRDQSRSVVSDQCLSPTCSIDSSYSTSSSVDSQLETYIERVKSPLEEDFFRNCNIMSSTRSSSFDFGDFPPTAPGSRKDSEIDDLHSLFATLVDTSDSLSTSTAKDSDRTIVPGEEEEEEEGEEHEEQQEEQTPDQPCSSSSAAAMSQSLQIKTEFELAPNLGNLGGGAIPMTHQDFFLSSAPPYSFSYMEKRLAIQLPKVNTTNADLWSQKMKTSDEEYVKLRRTMLGLRRRKRSHEFMGQNLMPGFSQFYPHTFPTMSDSRRNSHGTTNSSNTGGTPSPHSNSFPTSPPHIQGFLRTIFNSSENFAAATAAAHGSAFVFPPTAIDDDSMDKRCAVCNDRAICLHYGARTCEGCKGFFKRTVQKNSKYTCAGQKNCPIDKRYRSRCQYCRFQKCLEVGMVKQIVRHGSLSGRRGRLSSKTKSHRSADQPSPPLPLLALYAKANDGATAANSATTGQCYTRCDMRILMHLLTTEFMSVEHFCRSLPQIGELNRLDFHLLLARTFFPLFAIRLCDRMQNSPDTFIFSNGDAVPCHAIPPMFHRFFAHVQSKACQFKNRVEWESQSFAAFIALQLLSANSDSSVELHQKEAVDRVQSTIINALKDHCSSSQNKLAKIVAMVEEFDEFHQLGMSTLNYINANNIPLAPVFFTMLSHFAPKPTPTSAETPFGAPF